MSAFTALKDERSRVASNEPTTTRARVVADRLSKSFRVAHKEPGVGGTLRHLVARRMRQIDAVKDVSFTIMPGEIVGFLGANGAGKTTTLKMLTGLLHPSAGTARVDGHVPHERHRDFLRDITLVMGNKQQLMWDLPTLDTLRMNAAIYDISGRELQERTSELAQMLEIEDKLAQPVRKLSLGERMKAELLASLLHRPKILFLDEPTLGLDVNAQVAVRTFLSTYNARFGATILMTSHYMADITALCRRVLVIHDGQLIHDGALDALLHRTSPRREVRVEFRAPTERAHLESYGELLSHEPQVARFAVDPASLVPTVTRLLAELDVVDLSVQDAPVEEVIGRILRSG